MKQFIMNNPTAMHFGKEVLADFGETVSQYGKKALIVYGKGSVKNNGIYDAVVKQLEQVGVNHVEYSGIKSNPIIEDVRAAIALGKNEQIDVVIPVGGGSVLDTAKIVSIGMLIDDDPWKIMTYELEATKALPIIPVLTLAAAGSEMNGNAVIQNNASNQKLGFHSRLIFPKHSYLDPSFTLSVPKTYTGYGIADLIAHCLEAWFGKGEATLSDKLTMAVMQEATEFGPQLMTDLGNYDLREKVMYAATMALNELTLYGRETGDWGIHQAGHVLSVLYDIPHGASLTIVIPAWMKLMKERAGEKIIQLGDELFGVNTIGESIATMEQFFQSIDCPIRLSDVDISVEQKEKIHEVMIFNKVSGAHHSLSDDDLSKLIEFMI